MHIVSHTPPQPLAATVLALPLPGMPEPDPVAHLAAVYARQVADLAEAVADHEAREQAYCRLVREALAELRGALDAIAEEMAR